MFFLLASCTDSVLETVKMLRLCYASMAVLYNLQFWFIVLLLYNSVWDICSKVFQVADCLWASVFHVQSVSLCEYMNSHLSFTNHYMWFDHMDWWIIMYCAYRFPMRHLCSATIINKIFILIFSVLLFNSHCCPFC